MPAKKPPSKKPAAKKPAAKKPAAKKPSKEKINTDSTTNGTIAVSYTHLTLTTICSV